MTTALGGAILVACPSIARQAPRVVILGGGVGGLEAALAVRARAGGMVEIVMVAPESHFTYRAMTIAEPFGYRRPAPGGRIARMIADPIA